MARVATLLALVALVLGACASPHPSVAVYKAGVTTSKALDGLHHRVGKPCETCHGTTLSAGAPALPDTKKCLSCHGGTYEGHAARTAHLGPQNPHLSHKGQVACTTCHHGHRPFTYYCNDCHAFPVPEKYR